jgi:2'-5' RNA ligase
MVIEHRSFIVAEIPEPVRSQVQATRDSLNTLTAKLPVEITLAGSSGVGPIPAGTDLSLIKRHLDRILPRISPFRARFSAIRAFPNTSIFFLEPFDRSPFDQLHQELRVSGIPFSESQWPYNPHCTLCAGEPLSADAADELASRAFPQEEFWINTVSVYQLDGAALECKLLCQRMLGG